MEKMKKVYGITIYDSDDWGEWSESVNLNEIYSSKEKAEEVANKLNNDIKYLCEHCHWLDEEDIENIEEDTNIEIIIHEYCLI